MLRQASEFGAVWQRIQEATCRSGFGGRPGRHLVVATSRTITPSEDAGIVTVQGDIVDPSTAQRVLHVDGGQNAGH
ncbi:MULTISPECIES: hypothetical protein [Streptomyces]|uniref:hypothetical protein n=1 Tax=Streptomyces TaxID=1883 RepID=UPI00367FFC73